MPFEPLGTDEKLEGPPPTAERDMDGQMLFGCSGFVLAAVGGYVLAVWPYFLFQDTERAASLALATALGLLPAALLGGLTVRRFGLPGACGFLGGAAASASFLYLRVEQTFVAASAGQAPRPEYPPSLTMLLPVGWLLCALLLSGGLVLRGGASTR